MKSPILPFAALSLLLGACSSLKYRPVTRVEPPPPVLEGSKVTFWGEMPAYEQQGQYFRYRYIPRSVNRDLHGVVTVDAMVNADGTVHETTVFESSGNPEIDQIAEGMVQSAVYSLRLNPGDPAPHVVRRQIVVNNYKERYRAGPGVNTAYEKLSGPQPNFENQTAPTAYGSGSSNSGGSSSSSSSSSGSTSSSSSGSNSVQ
jgi:TonB family protein